MTSATFISGYCACSGRSCAARRPVMRLVVDVGMVPAQGVGGRQKGGGLQAESADAADLRG